MCFTYLFLQKKMSAAGFQAPGAIEVEVAIDFSRSYGGDSPIRQ